MTGTFRSSGGLLLAAAEAGELDEIQWTQIEVGGGLCVTISNDALKARIPEIEGPIRLPASYTETIAICNGLGCLPPTKAISDAIWTAAAVIVPPKALVFTPADARLMNTVEWTIRHNAAVDRPISIPRSSPPTWEGLDPRRRDRRPRRGQLRLARFEDEAAPAARARARRLALGLLAGGARGAAQRGAERRGDRSARLPR